MTVVYVVVAIVVLFAIALGASYNRFVHQRNLIRDSWHDIDAELQRRYDLVPNLVEVVRGYAQHEQQVMADVTAARANAVATTGTAAEQEGPERVLVDRLRGLLAVAEQYPNLKASEQFLALQHTLVDTEDRIQVARRIYNANVRAYDTRIDTFPSGIVARWFHFGHEPYFEVDRSIATPAVSL